MPSFVNLASDRAFIAQLPADRLVFNQCHVATLAGEATGYGEIADAAVVVRDSRIAWVGSSGDLPSEFAHYPSHSLGGRLVTPALIDCHTHLVFGGTRVAEFERRLEGETYEDISAGGGGIASTLKSTRAASFDALVDSALERLDALMAEGVCVVEVKSGYGLTIDHEIRLLRVARKLEQLRRVKVITTWLAAHALPPAYAGRSDAYVDEVVIAGLRIAHREGLVDAVDGYCETVGFSAKQIERIFEVAVELGIPVKLHAEQLSNQHGAALAVGFGAISVDHLEFLSPKDVAPLREHNTVAVLLPGAFYTLKQTQCPPVAALRANAVPMAVATDCNPGTSPLTSLLLAMNMSCTLFGLTPAEALLGTTRNAARALGVQADYGTLEAGKVADIAVWNVDSPAELSYWMGGSPLHSRYAPIVPS